MPCFAYEEVERLLAYQKQFRAISECKAKQIENDANAIDLFEAEKKFMFLENEYAERVNTKNGSCNYRRILVTKGDGVYESVVRAQECSVPKDVRATLRKYLAILDKPLESVDYDQRKRIYRAAQIIERRTCSNRKLKELVAYVVKDLRSGKKRGFMEPVVATIDSSGRQIASVKKKVRATTNESILETIDKAESGNDTETAEELNAVIGAATPEPSKSDMSIEKTKAEETEKDVADELMEAESSQIDNL